MTDRVDYIEAQRSPQAEFVNSPEFPSDSQSDEDLCILKSTLKFPALEPFDIPVEASLASVLQNYNLVFPKDSTWEASLADRSILKKMNKKEIKRQELCQEFICTEKSFVEKLIMLKMIYKDEMVRSDLFDPQFIELLFPHIEKLIPCQLSFISVLENSRINHIYATFIDKLFIFVSSSYGDMMKVLLIFSCAVHLMTVKKFMDLIKEDHRVAALFKRMESHIDLKRTDFKGLMGNVFQRPPRYTLLMNGILETYSSTTLTNPEDLKKHKACREYFENLNSCLNKFLDERLKHMTIASIAKYLDLKKMEPSQAQMIQDLKITEQQLTYEFSVMTFGDKKQRLDADLLVFEKFIIITRRLDNNSIVICTQKDSVAYLDLRMILVRDFQQEPNSLAIIDQRPIPSLWVILCKNKSQKKECIEKLNIAIEASKSNKETVSLIREYYTPGQLKSIFYLHDGKTTEVFLKKRSIPKKSLAASRSINNSLTLLESNKISASADDVDTQSSAKDSNTGVETNASYEGFTPTENFNGESGSPRSITPSSPQINQISLSNSSIYKKRGQTLGVVRRTGTRIVRNKNRYFVSYPEMGEDLKDDSNNPMSSEEIILSFDNESTIQDADNVNMDQASYSELSYASAAFPDISGVGISNLPEIVMDSSYMEKNQKIDVENASMDCGVMESLEISMKPKENSHLEGGSKSNSVDEVLDSLSLMLSDTLSTSSLEETYETYLAQSVQTDEEVSPLPNEPIESSPKNQTSIERTNEPCPEPEKKASPSKKLLLRQSLQQLMGKASEKTHSKNSSASFKSKLSFSTKIPARRSAEQLNPPLEKDDSPLQYRRSKHFSFTEGSKSKTDVVKNSGLEKRSNSVKISSTEDRVGVIEEVFEGPESPTHQSVCKQSSKRSGRLRQLLSRNTESPPSS